MRVLPFSVTAVLLVAALGLGAPALAHGECNPYVSSCGEFDNPDDGTNTAADHHHPDCEEGQPAAGSDPETGEGGLDLGVAFVCEGEHWDGDDHAAPSGGANEVAVNPGGTTVVAVNNPPGDEGPAGVTDPVHVRVSNSGTDVYVMTVVVLLGETGVGAGDGFVAWYGEDHTDLIVASNVLATPISMVGITRGHVADDDCNFETYENTRDSRACGRDNTAITVEY